MDISNDGATAPAAESRTSYFDVLGAANPKMKSSHFTYVAIIAGQFSKDADRIEYAAHYQKFFKRAQQDGSQSSSSQSQASDKITGMLLAFRTSFIHVLECPQKIMYAFLNDVANGPSSERDGSAFTESTRLLFLTDDLKKTLQNPQATRNYPFWASKIIDSKEDGGSVDWAGMDEAGIDEQITSVCVNLLSVGQSLSLLNKADMKHAFEDISDRYRGQIPTQTLAYDLASLDSILSLQDWQSEFQGHMKVSLESELVWPAPKPLLFA